MVLFGIGFIIFGIIVLYFANKYRINDNKDFFDTVSNAKGIIAGIGLIIIGILMLIGWFN